QNQESCQVRNETQSEGCPEIEGERETQGERETEIPGETRPSHAQASDATAVSGAKTDRAFGFTSRQTASAAGRRTELRSVADSRRGACGLGLRSLWGR